MHTRDVDEQREVHTGAREKCCEKLKRFFSLCSPISFQRRGFMLNRAKPCKGKVLCNSRAVDRVYGNVNRTSLCDKKLRLLFGEIDQECASDCRIISC